MSTKFARFNVFLHGTLIDTVFYVRSMCADAVRRSLIEHDGYSVNISVIRGK